ncbi:hypothetical protein ACQ86N_02835 [Puia sp. P3]|uniref:hypothetical protein n=1 Tax=Puia sp. P3 TaxID=3423952 RepID=UPI003D66922E
MNQFSNNGRPIRMDVISGQLLFIDPAYFEDIAGSVDGLQDIPRSDMKSFIKEVEKRVFPYGGGSLIGFRQLEEDVKTYDFDPILVTHYDSGEAQGEAIEKQAINKSITAFGTDTASFLVIDLANFDALLPLLHSDDLFDLPDNIVNGYIEKINSCLGNRGWAYVSSPGIGKGYDFEGDGSYFLKEDNYLQKNAYFGPLAMASAVTSDDPEMLEQVLLAGGNVNAELESGRTPMHLAMDGAIDGMLQSGRDSPSPEAIEIIRILVSHGADLEKRDWQGETALDSINSYAGNEEGFKSLVAMFREIIPSLDGRIQYQKHR